MTLRRPQTVRAHEAIGPRDRASNADMVPQGAAMKVNTTHAEAMECAPAIDARVK
ncbi:hypothetical protein [Streptomyces sp. NPDC058964]|uniref:hypothetical protein n=1 Tax=Streptomyces sp. NPDC058964 TaxID=3346681 RepID=UPI0036CA447A